MFARPVSAKTSRFLYIRLVAGLALVLACACGSDPKPAAAATDTAQPSDSAIADTPGGQDASAADQVGTDTVQSTPDVLQSPDVPAAVVGCASLLPCALNCPPVPKGTADSCTQKCANQTDSKPTSLDFDAVVQCAVSLCADATTTTARNGCVWEKCYDKLATCGGYGAGTATCLQTAECAGRCSLGNTACWGACLESAGKTEASQFAPIAACVLGKCGTVAASARGACIEKECQVSAGTCKGPGLDCTFTEGCQAKCPPVVPGSSNDCLAFCDLLTSPVALAQEASYTTCKAQCDGVLNKFDCYKNKCSAEQDACFAGAGTINCQEIYKCTKESCEGIGGDEVCIAGCVQKGAAKAKDGWVHYEGCILQHLNSAEAKNAGCSFPYDEASCLDIIKGFCSGESAACFKPQ